MQGNNFNLQNVKIPEFVNQIYNPNQPTFQLQQPIMNTVPLQH